MRTMPRRGRSLLAGVSVTATMLVAAALGPPALARAQAMPAAPAAAPFVLDSAAGALLTAVSCSPTSSLCAAVDDAGHVLTSATPAATTPWNSNDIDAALTLSAVSCAGQSFCAATSSGTVLTSDNAGNGSPWSSARIDTVDSLDALSCPSDTWCAAVSRSGTLYTTNDPIANSGWTSTAIDAGHTISSISCAAASMCAAVDASGQFLFTLGGGWAAADLDPTAGFTSVECPAVAECVAMDQAGRAFSVTINSSDSVSWSDSTVDGEGTPSALACFGTSICAAVDDSGHAITAAGPAELLNGVPLDIDGTTSISGVACFTSTTCIAVDEGPNGVLINLSPPAVLSPPQIDGAPVDGMQLDATDGTWSGDPTSYGYQWERCDASGAACVPIAGATAVAYTLQDADVGSTLVVEVTATGAAGTSVPAASAATPVVQRTSTTGTISIITTTTQTGGSPAPGGGNSTPAPPPIYVPNPAHNIQLGRLPGGCGAHPLGTTCENADIYYLDQARHQLGLSSYDLPADFIGLSAEQQIFILSNLDRLAYGIPAVPGTAAALDHVAAQGVLTDDDPLLPANIGGGFDGSFDSNWAGGSENALEAYFGWVYDDGLNSGNLDCTRAGESGCWGHRQDMFAFQTPGAQEMGVAAGPDASGAPSYAQIIAEIEPADGPFQYSWAQAVAAGAGANPYNPGVPTTTSTPTTGSRAAAPIRLSVTGVRRRGSLLRISFAATGAYSSLRCSLVVLRHGRPVTRARFVACRGSIAYGDVVRGLTYRFTIRAFRGGVAAAVVNRTFRAP